jgi:hypothetical protein
MSYRCQVCNEAVAPGVAQHKHVTYRTTKRRELSGVDAYGRPLYRDVLRKEIASEVVACPECHRSLQLVDLPTLRQFLARKKRPRTNAPGTPGAPPATGNGAKATAHTT